MFSKPLQPRRGCLFRSAPETVPFSMFSKPLKPKKSTFSFRTGKRLLFRCFLSLSNPKKYLFGSTREKNTFFGVFQASQAQISSPKEVPFSFRTGTKGTFFSVFQASQAQKRYLFRSSWERACHVRPALAGGRRPGRADLPSLKTGFRV